MEQLKNDYKDTATILLELADGLNSTDPKRSVITYASSLCEKIGNGIHSLATKQRPHEFLEAHFVDNSIGLKKIAKDVWPYIYHAVLANEEAKQLICIP